MLRRSPISFLVLTVALLAGGPVALAEGPAHESGWMGVTIEGAVIVDDDGNGGGRSGVRLGRIFEDSPAAAAGLRAQDVVLDVGGRPIASARELAETIREHGSRSWIPLSIWRQGHQRDVRIRLGTRPGDTSSKRLRRGQVGLAAIDLPPALRRHFGAEPTQGVMIAQIAEGSPAEVAGVELGDVLVSIDEHAVRGPAAMQRLFQGAGVGNTVELIVMRDGVEIVLEVVVAHDARAAAASN